MNVDRDTRLRPNASPSRHSNAVAPRKNPHWTTMLESFSNAQMDDNETRRSMTQCHAELRAVSYDPKRFRNGTQSAYKFS
ncbi:hypothetical protein K1T71_010024 [Dendrolimus kikuchii]|uniref:Uncharacterized protein n=1 Tax=Dendrolimus kikuchii TaxID=765133 RepID=A0ACC1CQP0_9NEOP|nr:hypothetical protein K1T71_010024 [Dendrolimus kikuchii]